MTFSLVARCEDTGMFGIAISSSSPAVAARCSWAKSGVGAVATQNITDPALGPAALGLMNSGSSAKEALTSIASSTEYIEYRQLIAVDGDGTTHIHSGSEALGTVAEFLVANAASAGNLLANNTIPEVMVSAFQSSVGHIGDRLITSLLAGAEAGGEAGPVHSAGLLIVDKESWPVAELRCDWLPEDCPIENIAAAWACYKPQLNDYVQRAHNPTLAPSYGVPGDE